MEFRSRMTVRLVKSVANDADVAKAARVSTIGSESLERELPTEGLINFLMRDRHGSPFEHNSMTFLVQAPIFVAREHFRHRAGWSYNEESARYRELKPSFYIPAEDRNLVQVGKPGAYTFEPGTFQHRGSLLGSMRVAYGESYRQYLNMLEDGIAREVARCVLPVGTYTSYYATCNARSLMHFLSLRTIREGSAFPSFPQREIEMVAEGMEREFQSLMPHTHAAYEKNGRVAP
ncbi:FAD-dependent thymidylate synthase [Streptomyces alfalfae]|uniref:FAD-dependent thymidylate synthase n=1 Tax=Streptomyces alfalfae TaxID=1642299 RepID=UPI001BA5588B|nr:FAD-dependent thymidylate synthase [Streptomyces alfalfae]QUI30659.1 FAD-dependent thymidylate synthase [Streptomyces alfalfae]